MLDFGGEIAKKFRVGDLVVLSGELGAGKTALTQGIGRELGISGITSPTFVISRLYNGKVPLLHVDAYRLLQSGSAKLEFDDLDLGANLDKSITVIEWGSEVAPLLKDEFLELRITFAGNDVRLIESITHGDRWQGFKL
jgi:tRNA threonylcarbamoyladenosine biosynthesis protein TsaE